MQATMTNEDVDDDTVAADAGCYDDHVQEHNSRLKPQQTCFSSPGIACRRPYFLPMLLSVIYLTDPLEISIISEFIGPIQLIFSCM